MFKKILKKAGHKIRIIARSGKKHSLALFSKKESRSLDSEEKTGKKISKDLRQSANTVEHAVNGVVSVVASPGEKTGRKKKKKWDVNQFHVVEKEGEVRFHDLGLSANIMHAIADLGFKYCTPIQARALPELLKGKDLIGKANTGTGKSAVFLLTLLTKLQRDGKRGREKGRPKALIIAPTRELVMQISKDAKDLAKYTHQRIVSVYGGVDYGKQMKLLTEKKCDVVAATPGRLLDFLGKNIISLEDCEMLVIDEADRMLDMGFIPDVRRIIYKVKKKKNRQTMLFSATVTDEVQRLASQWCKDPVLVEIEPEQVAVDTVEQIIYLVTTEEKYTVLYNLIAGKTNDRIMVFTNQKNEAKKLQDRLKRNAINCTLLSGDVPQKKRMQRLEAFRSGKVNVLVATDVAGRGIHIEGISHVVNYTLPYEPEDYVHRIGRTGRAGAEGVSVSFACEEGGFYLPEIESFIGRKLDCVAPKEELLVRPPKGTAPVPSQKRKKVYHRRKPR